MRLIADVLVARKVGQTVRLQAEESKRSPYCDPHQSRNLYGRFSGLLHNACVALILLDFHRSELLVCHVRFPHLQIQNSAHSGAWHIYFVFICTLVRAVTIYLQGAVFAVVISGCAYGMRVCGLLSSLSFVATTRAREIVVYRRRGG